MNYFYLLVENQTTVLLGPTQWRPRYFQSELTDLEVEYALPLTEPGYIKINDMLELFPLGTSNAVSFDPIYQAPVGPYYTYVNNEAHENYTYRDVSIAESQSKLVPIVTAERYRREHLTTTATVQSTVVTLDTSRDTRNAFIQKFLLMGVDEIATWKFPEGWITLTKADVETCIKEISTYVQTQFDWENSVISSINSATTQAELKSIFALEFPPTPGPATLGGLR
jgi:hypothetical protein